jgi:hypothetical protein
VSEEQMSEALDAIHDEAEKLLARDDLPSEVEDKVSLIMSIARHQMDVRTEEERGRA